MDLQRVQAVEDEMRTRAGASPADVGVTLGSSALNPKAPKLLSPTPS
jgi:hypothetical protein